MQTKIRTFAILAALLLTGLVFVLTGSSLSALVAWANGLSSRQQSVLRSLCLFAPIIVICIGVAIRNRRRQLSELVDEDRLDSARPRDAVRARGR